MRRFFKTLAIAAIVVVAGLLVGAILLLASCRRYWSQQSLGVSFLIDCDFDQARKIMVRTDPLERLVAACGRRIVNKQVRSVDVSTDKLINGNWDLNCRNYLVEDTPDPLGGRVNLFIIQSVRVQPDRLTSRNVLDKPTGHFLCQDAVLTMQRSGKKTLATIDITAGVTFYAPWCPGLQDHLDGKVTEGIQAALRGLRDELTKVVTERKGQTFLFKVF